MWGWIALSAMMAAGPTLEELLRVVADPRSSPADRAAACVRLAGVLDPDQPQTPQAAVALGRFVGEKGGDPHARKAACRALCACGRHARAAVGDLAGALREGGDSTEWSDLHAAALDVLARCGADGVAVLAQALAEPDFDQRVLAAEYLGDLRHEAAPALPVLRRCLHDSNHAVAFESARAVLRVDPAGGRADAVPVLGRFARDVSSPAALRALSLLGDLGPDAAAAVEDLRAALRSPPCQAGAAFALGRIGPAARLAAPDLRALLEGRSERPVVALASALWKVGHDPAAVAVLRAEYDRSAEARADVLLGFAFGEQLPRSVAQELRDDWDRHPKRRDALLAMALYATARAERRGGLIHDGVADAVRCFGQLLDADETSLAHAAFLGPDAAPLVPRFVHLLERQPEPAIAALAAVGPAARPAVPVLWKMARDDPQAEVRFSAALAVAAIVPARADEAVAHACRMHQPRPRDYPDLARFGPRARAALPVLRGALRAPNRDEYLLAADAVWAIDPDEARRLCLPGSP